MDSNGGILFLLGWLAQLVLLQLRIQFCEAQAINTCSNLGDIRLVDGTGPYEGRVEVCYSGEWKTVCRYGWSNSNAKVVCAQLNYPSQDALSLYGAQFGQGNGSILERIDCSGSELELINCNFTDYPYYYGYCNHAQDVGVRCLSCSSRGAVRLRGTSSQHNNYGRVEICVNGVWGTICDDSWGSTDTNVLCKELGFSRFGSNAYHRAFYGAGTGPIHLDNVGCRGTEQRLIDCPYTNNTLGWDCTHREDASVYCQTTLRCQEGSLRLTGESSSNQGTVEICADETWGTICATNWGQFDATVACRQLGFSVENGAIAQSIYGTGSVHYSDFRCNGGESELTSCGDSRGSSCPSRYRYYKAGVYCYSGLHDLPSPVRFHATCTESNQCTFTWQPPPIRQESIVYYAIDCSTHNSDTRRDEWTYSTYSTYRTVRLQPHQIYNCCVAAVNRAGRGNSICQTIITYETAPIAAPINIEVHQLNSTSVFLSWRPPLAQHRNGIIRSYYIHVELNSTDEVELSEVNSTETKFEYITQNQHLIMDDLWQFAVYTCRVAAYTVERGPFSEPLTIVLSDEEENQLATEEENQLAEPQVNTAIATVSTLLAVVIMMVGIYFAVLIGCKVAKSKKRRRVERPIQNNYSRRAAAAPAAQIKPKPRKPVENTLRKCSSHNTLNFTATRQVKNEQRRYHPRYYDDSHVRPPNIPPRTHSLNKIDRLENVQLQVLSDWNYPKLDTRVERQSKNPYQPLIIPPCNATASEYQSLTQFRQCQRAEAKF